MEVTSCTVRSHTHYSRSVFTMPYFIANHDAYESGLSTHLLPIGNYPHMPAQARADALWYRGYQRIGSIEVVAQANATHMHHLRHQPDSHITWSTLEGNGKFLPNSHEHPDHWRREFLQPPPAAGARNRHDLEQYRQMVFNIIGGEGNRFICANLNDLRYFLLHCTTRHFFQALPLIRDIQVDDVTSGVAPANLNNLFHMLGQCTSLGRLRLSVCRRCREFENRTTPQWLAWMGFRHNMAGNGPGLTINLRRGPLCAACRVPGHNNVVRHEPAAARKGRRRWMATKQAALRTAILS